MQAYIAGIIPMSTSNWRGNICSVVRFAGCDFKCPYCNVSDILSYDPEYKVSLKDIKEQLKQNISFIDSVMFSGGESMLQMQAALNLARFVKNMNLKLGIETNGTKSNTLKALLREGLVDFVALDIKAPFQITVYDQVTKCNTYFKSAKRVITDIKKTIKLIKESEVDVEVRTTIVPGLMSSTTHLMKIAPLVSELRCSWVLQQFRSDVGNMVSKKYKRIKATPKDYIMKLRKNVLKEYPWLYIEVRAVS